MFVTCYSFIIQSSAGLRVRWVAEEAAVERPSSSARGLGGERLEAALDDERNLRPQRQLRQGD